jgi:tetratricopeptide (TPR) repeat protein
VDFDRPVRDANPSFTADPNNAAFLDELEAIRQAKSSPNRSTEEVELRVKEDKLTGHLVVADSGGPSISNNYSGAFEIEAYAKEGSKGLLRKVKREFNGFTQISRREPFITGLSYFADDAYLRGDYVTAMRFYDQIRKVAPDLARVRFYLASSLEWYAGQQTALKRNDVPALAAAMELYNALSARAEAAPINRVYQWLALTNLIRIVRVGGEPLKDKLDVLTKRLQTDFPAGIEDVLARIDHSNQRDKQAIAKAYYDLGNDRVSARDRDGATAYYTKAVTLDPSFAEGYYASGIVAHAKGDSTAAAADYDRAIEANSLLAPAYANRGRLKLDSNRFDEAIEDYNQAVALSRSFARAFNERGSAKEGKGDLDGALADYKQAMALDPSAAEPYTNSGNVKVTKGQTVEVMADYNHSLELNPNNAVAYSNRGRVRDISGDLEGALQDYDRSIALDPKLTQSFVLRGIVKQEKGDLEGAESDFSKAISIDPKFGQAFGARGDIKQRRQDWDGALVDYGKAIELDPKDVRPLFNRGLVQAEKGNLDVAIDDYTRAIGIDPKLAVAYLNRARALARKGDFKGSVADYNRVLELDPNVGGAQVERGKVKSWSGDPSGALEDFAKVLQRDPTDVDALMNRAFVREARAEWDAAIDDYTKVIAVDSHIFDAYMNRGILRSAQRAFDGALSDFIKAREIDPNDKKADYVMLYTWLTESRLGGRDKATRELRDAVRRRTKLESWPLPIAQALVGDLTEEALFQATRASAENNEVLKNHLCEAYFFIGGLHLLNKDVAGASELFQRSVDTQATGNSEHRSATAELRQIKR